MTRKEYNQLLANINSILGKKNYKLYPENFKLDLLIILAEEQKNTFSKYLLRKFKYNKQPKIFLAKRENKDCRVCLSEAKIRHHIVQLQYGGNNNILNLIPLCCKCHKKIHPWL